MLQPCACPCHEQLSTQGRAWVYVKTSCNTGFCDDDVSVINACVFQGDGHSAHQFKYKPRRLLHQAAMWNNAAMAAVLLSHDADKNARDFSVSSSEVADSVFSSVCCTQRSVVDASQAEILRKQHRQALLCYCCYDCAASVNEVSGGIEGRWDSPF